MGIHDTDPNTSNKEFAPEGWSVPSNAEWTILENELIANDYNYDGTNTEKKIAKAMASRTRWNDSTNPGAVGNDQSTNNSSGFNAFSEVDRNLMVRLAMRLSLQFFGLLPKMRTIHFTHGTAT